MSDPDPAELYNQGQACFDRGDFHQAIAYGEQAASLARARGDVEQELGALNELAAAYGNLGDVTQQAENATRLLVRARQEKSDLYEVAAILRLTEALADIDLRGRWPELRPLLEGAVITSRRLNDYWLLVYTFLLLGTYSVRMGELEAGFAWLQEALTTLTPDVYPAHVFRSNIYCSLSQLMRERGEQEEAVRYAEMAVGEAQLSGNPKVVCSAHRELAQAERARGERAEALRLLEEEVLPPARQHGWQDSELEAELQRSELERELGHPETAVEAARRALELARACQFREDEVRALLSLGQALLAQGGEMPRAEAREVIRESRHLSQERDYADHFATAERLLQGAAL